MILYFTKKNRLIDRLKFLKSCNYVYINNNANDIKIRLYFLIVSFEVKIRPYFELYRLSVESILSERYQKCKNILSSKTR